MDKEISKTLSLPEVGYSRVWEDHRVLSKAVDVRPRDTALCITSSGDSVLNLLLDEPKRIIAVDMSVAQNCLLELKMAGIRSLNHRDFLVLLGETEDSLQRWDEVYATVLQSGGMPSYAKEYWGVHSESLRKNGMWCGKFEKYMQRFCAEWLPSVLTSEQIDEFLSASSLEEQRRIYGQWPVDKLREKYRDFVAPKSQATGRGEAKLKFVGLSDSELMDLTWTRLERTLRDVPVKTNFYLSWILRARRGFDPMSRPEYAPPCLTNEGFEKLKGLVDRIAVHNRSIEEYFNDKSCEIPSKIAVSNIFEYMSQESSDALFDTIGSQMPTGGRIVYWEYIIPRLPSLPANTDGDSPCGRSRLRLMEEECQQLRKVDRTFFLLLNLLEIV